VHSDGRMDCMDAEREEGILSATTHGVFWLAVGNAIGVMIAILLLFPRLNGLLGEWTYGRWMMVHMNLGLFGWCSIPMLGFLFRAFRTAHTPWAAWARSAVWLWSAALVLGSWSWLQGGSSGKLFLDWSGLPRYFFPLAMLFLWVVLAGSLGSSLRAHSVHLWGETIAKGVGLAALLAVPLLLFVASSPGVYPAFNPDTGGPTGASQLESSLSVVLLFLLVPLALRERTQQRRRLVVLGWLVLLAEFAYCALLNHSDVSHHAPAQYLGLCLMLVWIPLVPAYYEAFPWSPATRLWRRAFYAWWAGLVLSGCIFFLPGVLDHFKFTDGLVGHSLTAIAGCLTAYLILLQVQLLGNRGWIFLQRRSFFAWNYSVLLYVVAMSIAGWMEGSNLAFTIVPGPLRNLLYALRLLAGLGMFFSSLDWLQAALRSAEYSASAASTNSALSSANLSCENPA